MKLNLAQYMVRYKMQQVLFIILLWVLGLNLYVLIKYFGNEPDQGPGVLFGEASLPYLFAMGTIGGAMMGILLGALEIFVYPKFIRKKSFGFSISVRAVIFIVVIHIVTIILIFAYFDLVIQDKSKITDAAFEYYFSPQFLAVVVYLFSLNVLMDFILQVNQRMGPGTIFNLLQGRYFKPREEERIFMFLDLSSSTTIAEQLGHIKFSQLLQDCFRDLSGLLLKHNASVYQFVGDEAVLTWRYNKKKDNSESLQLFLEYEALLKFRTPHYIKKYGIVPVFYASVNAGMVTVAEVGDIKSEVAYHGDVLNTASRVQKLCKKYNEKILVTCEFKDRLPLNFDKLRRLDQIAVVGKKKIVEIFAVTRKEEFIDLEEI